MVKYVKYEVWQDGQRVASCEGAAAFALSDIMHTAMQYAQDGSEVTVKRVSGRKRAVVCTVGAKGSQNDAA